jgi:peroxiredoxin
VTRSDNLYALPPDLPVPVDDGVCDHLVGLELPAITLRSTRNREVALREIDADWVVLYCYPRTGLPDRDPPGGLAAWDSIPGARGCTPQACSYRDHYQDLHGLGAEVFGLSTQDTDYQREAANRLHLPFELLSDAELRFTSALRLPTFMVAGITVIKRLTLIVRQGRIEKCFYPVFPPDADAPRVIACLQRRRKAAGGGE